MITPAKPDEIEPIPDVEWWDSWIVAGSGGYGKVEKEADVAGLVKILGKPTES